MLTALKRFLPRRGIAGFNAVIEGTYHDEWGTLNYKLTNLDVPEDTRTIKDGNYDYLLYGKTEDFAKVERSEQGSLEVKIDALWCGPGIVLPYRGGIPNILERPRSIVFRDGRVFVDDGMMKDQAYIGVIQAILGNAHRLFEDKETNANYTKIIAQYNFGKKEVGGFTVYSQ